MFLKIACLYTGKVLTVADNPVSDPTATNVSPFDNTIFSWSKLTVSPAGTINALTIMLTVPTDPPLGTACNVNVLSATPVLQMMTVVIALFPELVYNVVLVDKIDVFTIAMFCP
jgi:hypothetical protein